MTDTYNELNLVSGTSDEENSINEFVKLVLKLYDLDLGLNYRKIDYDTNGVIDRIELKFKNNIEILYNKASINDKYWGRDFNVRLLYAESLIHLFNIRNVRVAMDRIEESSILNITRFSKDYFDLFCLILNQVEQEINYKIKEFKEKY